MEKRFFKRPGMILVVLTSAWLSSPLAARQLEGQVRDTVESKLANIEANMEANEQLIKDFIRQRNRAFSGSLLHYEPLLVPVVDEPPVAYSPAEVWQALSARRLERYGAIDLSGGKESERKIYRALNERGEIGSQIDPGTVATDLCHCGRGIANYQQKDNCKRGERLPNRRGFHCLGGRERWCAKDAAAHSNASKYPWYTYHGRPKNHTL